MNTASRLLKFSRLSGLSFLHSHLSGEAEASAAGEHLAKEYPAETHLQRWQWGIKCFSPHSLVDIGSIDFLCLKKLILGGLRMSLSQLCA